MQSKTAIIVENALKEVIENLGFELYEVEYKKQQNGMNLTLYIYSKNHPITINDCELVHKTVDPILDELDPTNGASYFLNVSSLGLDRPLKTDKDFERCKNTKIQIKLFSGKEKELIGFLKDFNNETIFVEINEEIIKIDRKNIAICKPFIDF